MKKLGDTAENLEIVNKLLAMVAVLVGGPDFITGGLSQFLQSLGGLLATSLGYIMTSIEIFVKSTVNKGPKSPWNVLLVSGLIYGIFILGMTFLTWINYPK